MAVKETKEEALVNILVLGSGGREHALAWALARSPRCSRLFAAPGNGGTAGIAENVAGLDIEDGEAVAGFARENDIGLVVVGPEALLVAGVADAVRSAGIACFGPDAQGAQLEGSKTYSKQFMETNGIPTARYASFTEPEPALSFARELGVPVVVKADGLAAGKGVIVAETAEAAEAAIRGCFEGAFGEAGSTVLVEEFLTGPECSLLALVAGGRAFFMPPAQDHKRAFDGDLGPNTGGMGVYSPVPIVRAEELAAMQDIMRCAAAATAADPFANDYRGVLYGGFMLTPKGPSVLEFNVRFGDPETQVVLPLLQSDFVDAACAIADGRPDDVELAWSDAWAVCVVLASGGYPGAYEKGKVILGVDEAGALPGVTVFHAGTARNADDELVSAGGRVLNVVALGDSFEEARARAYEACACINFEGKRYRGDIGKRAAAGRGAWE
ncbi:MAG: phosphoribosylamine--glycine ligase [Coriobacteriaceae bacterium]|nr:phosphoribosylamine--glycine ligase [Coriobacteriaceae bacterium]